MRDVVRENNEDERYERKTRSQRRGAGLQNGHEIGALRRQGTRCTRWNDDEGDDEGAEMRGIDKSDEGRWRT